MNIHTLFETMKAIAQDKNPAACKATSMIKIKRDFSMLPDEQRQVFILWVTSHPTEHLIDLIEEESDENEKPAIPAYTPDPQWIIDDIADFYDEYGDGSSGLFSPQGNT